MNLKELRSKYEKMPVTEYKNSVGSDPSVSVCIQTYQHADFIKDCLDGVLMQKTDFEYEILLGEDCSTDGTRDICIEYAKKFPDKIRLLLHQRENNIETAGSPSGRFNFLYNLCSAKGKYIAMCEGDDFWTDHNKLQKQLDYMESHPDTVMTFHKHRNVDIAGNVLAEKRKFLPCTAMFVNRLVDLPDMEDCPNGDRFLLTYFSLIGKTEYLDNIDHSIRRVHKGGVMSMRDEDTKLMRQALTWSSIYDAFSDTELRQELKRKRNFFMYRKLLRDYERGSGSLLQLAWYPIKTFEFRLYGLMIKKLIS